MGGQLVDRGQVTGLDVAEIYRVHRFASFVQPILHKTRHIIMLSYYIQPDQINMVVFFWYLVKIDCTVYTIVHAYIGQIIFYKVLKQHGHIYLVTL